MRDASSRLLAPTVDLEPDVHLLVDVQLPAEPDIESACLPAPGKSRQHLLDNYRQRQHPVGDDRRLARAAGEIIIDMHRVEIERGRRVARKSGPVDRFRHVNEYPLTGRRIRSRRFVLVGFVSGWAQSLGTRSQ